jgi:predicted enzyme related to lactoylglutathione lyase
MTGMIGARFDRVQLRTTDVAAARRFYARVLGPRELDVVELPAAIVARGVVPHWLGHIGVDDVEATAERFAALGATRLGPTVRGGAFALVRDPGGAVVALARPGPPSSAGVVWRLLNATDVERAKAAYAQVFGWTFGDAIELGELGLFCPFSWTPEGPAVGSMASIVGRPGVHPHWLFQFGVDALEPAVEAVREGGGVIVSPIFTLPDGDRLAVCDDAQGAAFCLREVQAP